MGPERQPWFAISPEGSTAVRCAACAKTFDLQVPILDHHPRVCPVCGVKCAFLSWKDRTIQVIPARAPAPFAAALGWSQEHLDELDYVELVLAMEEIADAIRSEASVD